MELMTTQYNSYDRRGSGSFYVFLLALVLGAIALGLFVRHAKNGAMGAINRLNVSKRSCKV